MRVFLAIDFPEEIKNLIIRDISSLRKTFPSLKWIKKTSLHLTLKFLGDTEPIKIAQLNHTLENAFKDIEPFILKTKEYALFPNVRKARLFYLGIEKSHTLFQCYKIIEEKLRLSDFEKEPREFHPHITLARIKVTHLSEQENTQLTSHSSLKMEVRVNEITLMQSKLLPDGARYTPVQRFSLRPI